MNSTLDKIVSYLEQNGFLMFFMKLFLSIGRKLFPSSKQQEIKIQKQF